MIWISYQSLWLINKPLNFFCIPISELELLIDPSLTFSVEETLLVLKHAHSGWQATENLIVSWRNHLICLITFRIACYLFLKSIHILWHNLERKDWNGSCLSCPFVDLLNWIWPSLYYIMSFCVTRYISFSEIIFFPWQYKQLELVIVILDSDSL